MSAQDARAQALELWRSGFERHRHRDLRAAVDLYRRSIETCPTPEAHTFLGWAYAHAGYVERAIAECKRAIEVDPNFGNPYNDIGAYLIEKGALDDAVPWLERAALRAAPLPLPEPGMRLHGQGRSIACAARVQRSAQGPPARRAGRGRGAHDPLADELTRGSMDIVAIVG